MLNCGKVMGQFKIDDFEVLLCTVLVTVGIFVFPTRSMADDMEVFKLPISSQQFITLGLPSSVAMLTKENRMPSDLLKNGISGDVETIDRLTWFFKLLDARFKVVAIAKKSEKFYLVLDSKKTKNTGCVFLPLSLAVEKSSSSKTRDVGDDLKKHVVCNGTLWDVLRFLKDSFDCIDITRKPFKWGGTNSEGIVDFTHYRTKEFKARWSDSCAFYLSLGGDTLLVDRDGAVAWHQLETGRIIPVGRIEEAIKRYLDFTIADEEFSSWTDNGQE